MSRTIPIPDKPELSAIQHPGWTEYRVDATTPRSKGRGSHISVVDAFVVLAYAMYWNTIISTRWHAIGAALVLLAYIHHRTTQLLWESVVIIPSLGLQLETHRGFAGISLSASQRFVPWSSLEDFLINEGIRGWNIRYYLVVISRTQQAALKLDVAFENILPKFPILLEVYHGVQDALRKEHGCQDIDSSRSTSTDSEVNK
ncbi:hypothetical protein GY45DRAFT_1309203 [Cubamyces sp. BRFM 1775]|nr:hypothetical protein GY45DRAFT_1309203 [Cubamyces sp. BRFM 1775]